MGKTTKHEEENPLYRSGFFSRLSSGLESLIKKNDQLTPGVINIKKLSQSVANIFADKQLVRRSGSIIRGETVDYFFTVLPYFGQEELKILLENPKDFVSKFSVNPSSRKDISLALLLFKKEYPQYRFSLDKGWVEKKRPIFDMFSFFDEEEGVPIIDENATYVSPFECLEKEYIEERLETIEECKY